MKKLLLASAVAALSITAAQAAPTIYGKAFLTLDLQDGDKNSPAKDSRSQLNSNASRLGVKGSENLTANTDLVYQLEYRLEVDDNTQQFTSRDTYLGLAHKQFGTLVAGRLTAIDSYVDYANVTVGGVIGGDNVLASFDAPRANNAFAYFTPERNGIQLMGMYVMDENNATDNLGRDAFGVGAKYEPSTMPVKAGVSYIQAGDFRTARVSGAYALSPTLTAGALYQHTKFATKGSEKENAFTVSANYKVAQTPWTAYGQVDVVDNVGGAKNSDAQRLAVGGKYAFNKNTTAHMYGAFLKQEVQKVDQDSYGVGAGIEYKF